MIRRVLTMTKRGTEVVYVTGNHDEFLRKYSGLEIGNLHVVDEAGHTTADGKRLLVVHGDQFDVITRYHRWLAFLGDVGYSILLHLNRYVNLLRNRYGYGYWSLSAWIKHKVKRAVNFISEYEEAVARTARRKGYDGVICGAWEPQTNGVVTTLQNVVAHLPAAGYEPRVVHPGEFNTSALPGYPEIRLARNPWRLADVLDRSEADAVHLATEGPLGLAARRYLTRRGIPFTTSLHTKFPEYIHSRLHLPVAAGYGFIRWFHSAAVRTMCITESQRRELVAWGLSHLVV